MERGAWLGAKEEVGMGNRRLGKGVGGGGGSGEISILYSKKLVSVLFLIIFFCPGGGGVRVGGWADGIGFGVGRGLHVDAFFVFLCF